jgi:hypothetical protein
MRFLKDMLQRYSRQVLTAGKADELVADLGGPKPNHSIFTGHVLMALEGAAATPEGVISALSLSSYVYEKVGKDQYSNQTPHFGFFDGDGDFLFNTSALPKDDADDEADGQKKDKDILVTLSPNISTEVEVEVETTILDTLKSLLSDPKERIRLSDFITKHTRHFLSKTSVENFPVQNTTISSDDFIERLKKYENFTSDLQTIITLMSRWSSSEQLVLLENIFTRIGEADKGSSGKILWLELGWYPSVILMYSAGIAAISAKRYDVLRSVLFAPVEFDTHHNNEQAPIITHSISHISKISDQFKMIPGHERHYTPRSEYLHKLLQPKLEDTLFLGRSYESLFDRFEIFQTLIYADNSKWGSWRPVGRFGWKYSSRISESNPYDALLQEAKDASDNWPPLKAGLFQGSYLRFNEVATKYKTEVLGKLHW